MATEVHVSVLMLLNEWLKWIHQTRPIKATLKSPLCVCQPFKTPYLTARVLIKLCWKHIKRTTCGVGQFFVLDLVIFLCLRQDNQNFTLVLDHYSQPSTFKCTVTWIIMWLYFLKNIFQLANTGTRWQPSAFQDYFLTNSRKKNKGRRGFHNGHDRRLCFEMVACFGFVGLSLSLWAAAGPKLMNAGTRANREHAATPGNLRNTCWNTAEPPRTSHELHCCSVFNQLSQLSFALSIHLYTGCVPGTISASQSYRCDACISLCNG